MKNIDYLELFFKKHNLSGKVKVRFSSIIATDDYISEIEFDDGLVVSINDIIFDIESEFPDDFVKQWMEDKKDNDVSLIDWVQTHTNYIPKELDTSSVREYQPELEGIVNDVKDTINKLFANTPDDEGSELENE